MTDIEIARGIVEKTNALLAKRYHPMDVFDSDTKSDGSIITETDLLANQLITNELQKYFPNDAIISEEAEQIVGRSKGAWYVDPLDGTSNFSQGLSEFAVCLAHTTNGQTDLGLIGLPAKHEIVWGKPGGPIFMNDRPITWPGKMHNPKKPLVFLNRGRTPEAEQQSIKLFAALTAVHMRVRLFGCAGVELAAVATGSADAHINNFTRSWDLLAGVLLVRAMGGRATSFEGNDWTINDTTLIASNGLIHDELLDLVHRAG